MPGQVAHATPDRRLRRIGIFRKEVTKKTKEKYDTILNAMHPDQWYKASEVESIVGVKESRVKVLLKDMTEQGLFVSRGKPKIYPIL